MDDNKFWELIGKLDCSKSGDADLVLKPLIDTLAEKSCETGSNEEGWD